MQIESKTSATALMEFSPPVFAAQFGVPFLWLAIVLLDGYRRHGSWRAPKRDEVALLG